jgi:hypothetical protein
MPVSLPHIYTLASFIFSKTRSKKLINPSRVLLKWQGTTLKWDCWQNDCWYGISAGSKGLIL